MKLAVFGSTGKTGRRVIEQALDRGYSVRAVARWPEAVTLEHENLTVIGGDILKPEPWGSCLAGADWVMSALV